MAVQQFADEQRRRRPKAAIKRRTHVEDDYDRRDRDGETLEDTAGELADDGLEIDPVTTDRQPTPAATDTTDEMERDMATKKKSVKKPAGRKKATAKKKAQRIKHGTQATKSVRMLKTYRLIDGIPDAIRKPSAGRSILEAIRKLEKDGPVTAMALRLRLGKEFSAPTLRFFLGKFQRDKVVVATPKKS